MSGAIGIEQLKKLPSFTESRQKNSVLFKKLFSNDSRFIIQKELGQSSWFGFSLILNDKSLSRKKLIKLLTKNKIDTRPIVTGNFANNDVMKYFDYEIHNIELNNAENNR